MKTWNTPLAIEIKMDAEISSYQNDDFDPVKEGPHFIENEAAESEAIRSIPRA